MQTAPEVVSMQWLPPASGWCSVRTAAPATSCRAPSRLHVSGTTRAWSGTSDLRHVTKALFLSNPDLFRRMLLSLMPCGCLFCCCCFSTVCWLPSRGLHPKSSHRAVHTLPWQLPSRAVRFCGCCHRGRLHLVPSIPQGPVRGRPHYCRGLLSNSGSVCVVTGTHVL